ncbi:MAG TPA: CHAD domain-containing protein [Tepidisphaeraceae bacterium]
MSFELKQKETVPEGIRRVVCERIDKAMQTLDGNGRKSVNDEAVHEARKRFKQVRGALRVVRKELGGKQFDQENGTFRDAGRPLSEVRDAKVMVDTLDQLAEHYKGQLAAELFKQLRGALESRRREVRKRVLDANHTTRTILREVRKSSRRVADWPLTHTGWKAIAAGLRQTYRQGRDAMREAIRDDSDEAFHEWRKRAKDLRYAFELLARTWPEAIQPMADAAHHLTDLLGQDHDLAVLQQIVENELKDVCADGERELLEPLVKQRRSDLKKEACELGQKIYAERADEFIDRLHGYWKAWS